MNNVRILLSLIANHRWSLQKCNVKNAFLHGDLDEKMYMEVPRFELKKNKACELRKALYGLKQYPMTWFGKFVKVMIDWKCLWTTT